MSNYIGLKLYVKEQYELGELRDIANHGCSGGVGGLVYYSDTTDFYNKWHDGIWSLLAEMADSMGEKNIMSLIASFGGAQHICNEQTFKNLVVWAAVEELASQLVAETDEEVQ